MFHFDMKALKRKVSKIKYQIILHTYFQKAAHYDLDDIWN